MALENRREGGREGGGRRVRRGEGRGDTRRRGWRKWVKDKVRGIRGDIGKRKR